MIPALVSHVTQKVLLCRYHAVMLARGWIRSHPQRQSSNLFRWSPHGTTLESTLLGQSPHCHTMATVTSWHWVTTSPSGSRQLLYLQSVHKGLLNLFSSYVLYMQVGYYLFQTTALHTVSADLHAYGIATSVDNRSRDGIPQPAQWRAHEESWDQTSSDHCIPPTGNICTTGFMHCLFTVTIANVIASLQ